MYYFQPILNNQRRGGKAIKLDLYTCGLETVKNRGAIVVSNKQSFTGANHIITNLELAGYFEEDTTGTSHLCNMKSFRVTSDMAGTEFSGAINFKFDAAGGLIVPLDAYYDIYSYIEVTTKGNKKAYTAINFFSDACGTEILKSKSFGYYNLTSIIQTGRHQSFKIDDVKENLFSSTISFELCPIIKY